MLRGQTRFSDCRGEPVCSPLLSSMSFAASIIILLCFHSTAWADKPLIADSETSVTDIIQALQKQKMRDYRDFGGIAEDDPPKIAALIHFEIDSATILEESKPLLNKFGQALQSDKLAHSTLMIAGHTDNTGTNIYNLALSYRRAESVKNYLKEQYGLTEQRLIIRAYGEGEPIDSNDTAQGRTINHRVEFIRID
ncbi:MAG: OmpA family protein [Thiomargarita sp.]|nr:OmpA family protein [Thiomargarita sp.]